MQNGPPSIRRRVLSLPTLVSLALAAAFLVFLLTRFDVDLAASWQQVKGSNPWYLALAWVVHYTTFIFRGARWRVLLHNAEGRVQSPPGVLYCSQLVLLGWFANSVAWFRLGDAYRAYLYRYERGASFSRTIGTILSERVLDTLNVVLLLAVAVPFLAQGGSGWARKETCGFWPIECYASLGWPVVGASAALLGLLAFLLALILVSGIRWTRWLPGWLAEGYQRFRQGVVGSFGQLPLVALWGILGWLAEIHRLYLVAAALGVELSYPLIVFLTLANSLLTLVPTPGGIGAVESGVAGLLLRLSSMSASGAAALVLIDRSITYLSVIAVGAVLFIARQAWQRRRPA